MTYEEFKADLLNMLNEAAKNSEYISSFLPNSMMKNNDNCADAIHPQFVDGKGISPCCHPEELFDQYQNGDSLDHIVSDEVNKAEYFYTHSHRLNMGDLSSDEVKGKLFLQLVSGEGNPLMTDNCAHLEFNDLICVPRCQVEIDGQLGSFLVNRHIQAEMKLTDDELMSIARQNTFEKPYSLRSMADVLSESLGMDLPAEAVPNVLVLSNESGVNGAIEMLNPKAMLEASARFEKDNLYLIPSSINEILLMRESEVADPAALSVICSDVTENVVEKNDRLCTTIYRYDAQTQKISICNNLQDLHNIQNTPDEQTQKNNHRQAI